MNGKYRVLITGATGFIGRHFKTYLCDKECDVICSYRGKKPNDDNRANVFWVNIGEINAKTDWSQALDGVQYVVHIAGVAHRIGYSQEELKVQYDEVNINGVENLIKQVKCSSTIKRFVFLSTLSVYASNIEKKINEKTICDPDNYYGKSKYEAEHIIIKNLISTSIDWSIVRPTLVYGKGNPGNMERLINLIKSGLPLPFSMIKNKRSLLYVGNLVSALYQTMINPEASNKIYLLSDGQDVSTRELVDMIRKAIKKAGITFPLPVTVLRIIGLLGDYMNKINYNKYGIDSYSIDKIIGSLEVDSSPIRNELSWQPPYSVHEGIKSIFI